MVIGIFSKLGSNGGSEHRCVELANAIARYTHHDAVLLSECEFNRHLRPRLDPAVPVVEHLFLRRKDSDRAVLYAVDRLLVVNSDSPHYCRPEFWDGTIEDKHARPVDLSRLPTMTFLFNFIIGPAQNLARLRDRVHDLRVVLSNREQDRQFREDARFAAVRDLPRTILRSPIDPGSVTTAKTPDDRVRIGKHSMPLGYKFDQDTLVAMHAVNAAHPGRVRWDWMGVPPELKDAVARVPDCTVRPAFSVPVGRYLSEIDVFLFLISWGRKEPWSRSVAEAMMAGCPVVATDSAGNKDQVEDGVTGFVCRDVHEVQDRLGRLVVDADLRRRMGEAGALRARDFTSDRVVGQYVEFLA